MGAPSLPTGCLATRAPVTGDRTGVCHDDSMLRRGRGSGLVPAWVLALACCVAACGGSEDIAGQTFRPATPGLLTVATSLPAPGFWAGDAATDVTGGFEWGIAGALADRFGLELRVVDVPFAELVDGDLGGADLALAQITITDERARRLAFSDPYYVDDAGVVVPAGDELTDLETARERSWVVQRGSVEEELLDDTVRPDEDPILVDDAVAALDAVADGSADAALVDLSTALVLTNERDDVTTAARFARRGEIAAALPLGSANVEVVDAGLRALAADRTLGDLERRYLAPVFETAPDSLPVIRTPDD